MKRILLGLLMMAAAITGARAESGLDTVTKRGTLVVGTSLGTPPFGMTNDKMEPDGFDVTLAKLIARDLGVKVQIVDTVAANRVPSVATGKADIVISSFTITAERARAIAFTSPVFMDQQVMFGPKDRAIATLAATTGKRIGVTRSSTNDIAMTRQNVPGVQIQRYEDDASTNQALLAGQVDSIVTSAGLARSLATGNPAMEIKFVVSQAPMAIGVRRDDPEFLHWLNTEIFLLWVNKELPALQEKWFGAANAALPTF